MPIVPIIQPVYYSETFYTEYFHCIPICSKFAFSYEHHVIDSTFKHKDALISNITRRCWVEHLPDHITKDVSSYLMYFCIFY